jgi:hypothetical protein
VLLAGPTVRRIHREREMGMRQSVMAGGGEEFTHTLVPAGARRQGLAVRSGRTPNRKKVAGNAAFPLDMATVLGLGRDPELAVMDGRVGRICRRLPGVNEPVVALAEKRWPILFSGPVRERLTRSLRPHLSGLRHWAGTQTEAREYADLDSSDLEMASGNSKGIGLFVNERLIPRLRGAVFFDEKEDMAVAESLVDGLLARLEPEFAFVDGRWYGLVPFCGEPGPRQPEFTVGKDRFLGLRVGSAVDALARYDAVLREAVRAVFPAEGGDWEERGYLYRGKGGAVMRTPSGRYFACLQMPPYVVEGDDRKLYSFEAVEIGIQVVSTDVRKAIRPVSVQVLHAYRHMFVSGWGGGNFICMPRPESYYEELCQLPLEEALMRHLESARMTLCAGYTPLSSPAHSIQSLGRPVLSEEEAQRRGLLIYRYPFRSKGSR